MTSWYTLDQSCRESSVGCGLAGCKLEKKVYVTTFMINFGNFYFQNKKKCDETFEDGRLENSKCP